MIYLLFLCILPVALGGDYANTDNVVYLTRENFTENINSGRWLVIFYFRSCGTCIRYHPFFANFASYLKSWTPLLNVGALDCQGITENFCFKYEVEDTPHLRYFPGTKHPQDPGLKLRNINSFTDLRDQLLNLLQKEIPLDSTSSDSKVLHSILSEVVETNTTSSQTTATTTTTAPDVTEFTEQGPVVIPSVYADDIFRSLTIMFYNDISLSDEIGGHELAALREFLSILGKLLPASANYKSKLKEMYQWIDTIYQHPVSTNRITGNNWYEKLEEIQFPQFNGEFVACKGSNSNYRGYPCGLWVLFHSLTVQHYRLSRRYPELEGDAVAHAMNRFIPRFFACRVCAFHFAANSANIVREGEPIFPEHREWPSPQDFKWNESILAVLPSRPTTASEEVLWLNAVHNRVNSRLSGDPTEDPLHKKVQYPPRKYCPACWSPDPNRQGKFVLGKTEASKVALFNFLVEHYQPKSWKTASLTPSFLELSRTVNWEDNTSKDFVTIVIVAVVITVVGLLALLLISGFIMRCRKQQKGGVLNYSRPI